jgi:hypothetical protein
LHNKYYIIHITKYNKTLLTKLKQGMYAAQAVVNRQNTSLTAPRTCHDSGGSDLLLLPVDNGPIWASSAMSLAE